MIDKSKNIHSHIDEFKEVINDHKDELKYINSHEYASDLYTVLNSFIDTIVYCIDDDSSSTNKFRLDKYIKDIQDELSMFKEELDMIEF